MVDVTKITSRAKISIEKVSDRNPELRTDEHVPMGFVTEDYIIVRGFPAMIEQLVQAVPVVSAEGLVIAERADFEDQDNGALVRFSPTRGLNVSEWLPYMDNTWGAPRIGFSAPPTVQHHQWVNGRNLFGGEILVQSGFMELFGNGSFQTGSMSVLMALSPTQEPTSIVFDELVVTIKDGSVEMATPRAQATRRASTGAYPTVLAMIFNRGRVNAYIKAGYEPLQMITLSADTSGSFIITGPIGIFSIDLWDSPINASAKIEEILWAISGKDIA